MSSLQDPPNPVQSGTPVEDIFVKDTSNDLKAFKDLLYDVLRDERTEDEVKLALTEAYQRIDETYAGCGNDFIFEDPILSHALFAFRMPDQVLLSRKEITDHLPGEELSEFSLSGGVGWSKLAIRVMMMRALHLGEDSFAELARLVPAEPVVYKENPRLAIFGDAGYKGLAQDKVKGLMKKRHAAAPFNAIIHLGDIYFAATEGGILRNFLSQFRSLSGARYDLFALPGNHDIYYGGSAFAETIQALPQPGRYFLIETPDWRVVCLDTALADPTLFRSDGLLDPDQFGWLRDIIEAKDEPPIILLSHHYFVSAWDEHGKSLRNQLATLVRDKVFAWYWGHEHACAAYGRGTHGFYGACVGNGAFRNPFKKYVINPDTNLDSYPDSRCTCFPDANDEWPHGFLELELKPGSLIERYHVENAKGPWFRTLNV